MKDSCGSGPPGYIHRKKKVCEFPVPSRDVTTKLSLGGNNDFITELFLPRGNLVSDILAGDGKLVNLFLQCSQRAGTVAAFRQKSRPTKINLLMPVQFNQFYVLFSTLHSQLVLRLCTAYVSTFKEPRAQLLRLNLIPTPLDLIQTPLWSHRHSAWSHPHSARSHPHSARSYPHSAMISSTLGLVSSTLR
jgi:hypothetical protein